MCVIRNAICNRENVPSTHTRKNRKKNTHVGECCVRCMCIQLHRAGLRLSSGWDKAQKQCNPLQGGRSDIRLVERQPDGHTENYHAPFAARQSCWRRRWWCLFGFRRESDFKWSALWIRSVDESDWKLMFYDDSGRWNRMIGFAVSWKDLIELCIVELYVKIELVCYTCDIYVLHILFARIELLSSLKSVNLT